jgi:predicted DNA-binding transcriptional regulator AlpA
VNIDTIHRKSPHTLFFGPYGANMTKKHPSQVEQPTPRKPFIAEPHHIWLTPRGMVDRFGRSIPFWYRKRKSRTGPPFFPIGGKSILYRLDLVEAWFEQHLVTGFDDPKYKELAASHRASGTKSQRDRKVQGAQGRETVHPLDGSKDLGANRPIPSARPKVFRFLPQAPWKPGLPTALEVAMATPSSTFPQRFLA